ncbi:hypothetical protein Tco_0699276 [Tanacetum coccineum]
MRRVELEDVSTALQGIVESIPDHASFPNEKRHLPFFALCAVRRPSDDKLRDIYGREERDRRKQSVRRAVPRAEIKDLEDFISNRCSSEYFDQSKEWEPVPTATVDNAPISGPTIEDTSITPADLHPPVNLVAGEPSSEQSTSGDVSLSEPNQVTQPPDHLRRWTKDHPLITSLAIPLVLYPPENFSILCFVVLFSILNGPKVETQELSKWSVIEDCWFQIHARLIHELDRLKVWEFSTLRPIYVYGYRRLKVDLQKSLPSIAWKIKKKIEDHTEYSLPMAADQEYDHLTDGCQNCFSPECDLQEEVFVQSAPEGF